MTKSTENKAAEAGATLYGLIIRTGRAGCYAHFYPTLYQLFLVQDGLEEKVDLSFSGSLLLERLLQNPGELVSREELMSHAWSDRVVGQGSLNQQVYTLRQILTDEKNREIIQTLPRRGYMINPKFISHTPLISEPLVALVPGNETPDHLPAHLNEQQQTRKNQYGLLLTFPLCLALFGSALLIYMYVITWPTELFSNQLKIGQTTITYVDRDEQQLQQLGEATQTLAKRMAALAKQPTDLIFGTASGYYEVLCLDTADNVHSLIFHESQLHSIANAQLEACLP
jgi:DNA-binding winged helix-turn-helix (wHTH) protein